MLDDETEPQSVDDVEQSDYEKMRDRNIAENNQVLAELGLQSTPVKSPASVQENSDYEPPPYSDNSADSEEVTYMGVHARHACRKSHSYHIRNRAESVAVRAILLTIVTGAMGLRSNRKMFWRTPSSVESLRRPLVFLCTNNAAIS